MAIDQKLINEINALAHKKKTVGLTPEEQVRQQKLRQKYLKEFRRGFEQQLQSIKVVDANGNDVTPAKARMHKKINLTVFVKRLSFLLPFTFVKNGLHIIKIMYNECD